MSSIMKWTIETARRQVVAFRFRFFSKARSATPKRNQLTLLFLTLMLHGSISLVVEALFFDATGCLSSCCCNCCCPPSLPFLGANQLCCGGGGFPQPLGCCALGGGCCGYCAAPLPLFSIPFPTPGALPPPLPPMPPPPPLFSPPPPPPPLPPPPVLPPSLAGLAQLLCAAPPCGCGGFCAPPLLARQQPPPVLQRAPIVPVPRILQPPSPLPPPPPQREICAIPVAQCLVPCRSSPCRNNCCDNCFNDYEEDFDDNDDFRRRRRRRSVKNAFYAGVDAYDDALGKDYVQRRCHSLLHEAKLRRRKNAIMLMAMKSPFGRWDESSPRRADGCSCPVEQEIRCRRKRMMMEMICQQLQRRRRAHRIRSTSTLFDDL